MKNAIWVLLTATALAGCDNFNLPPPQSTAAVPATQEQSVRLTMPPASVTPDDLNVLFWNDDQRADRFRHMERWFAGYEVAPAKQRRDFASGPALPQSLQNRIAAFVAQTNAAGIMVIEDGRMRHAEYGLDFDASQRWTSFSVAKSFTSTLLGAALRDGQIASLDDPVITYLPEMADSEYAAVTIRQLATMTSGIRWNENYADPESDVAKMGSFVAEPGEDAIVTQLKTLTREAPAGEKFVYKTGETNLLGVLVERAVGVSLAEYSKTKIADPAGFASPMFWMIEPSGRNIGGCCLSLTLGDYARFGQFALENGGDVVPEGWFAEAGGEQVSFGANGFGYGYQWWTYPGAAFGAQGIFGQAITIVPDRKLVVAVVSNWPSASSQENRRKWQTLVGDIATAE